MTDRFDIIILGGGNAGFGVSAIAAPAGKRIAFVEQRDDPEGHDLPAVASRIACPVLIVHGEADPSVPAICARQLADAVGEGAEVLMIPGADHVFQKIGRAHV